MADILYGMSTGVTPITATTQTFTDSNFGGIPKLAIFVITGCTSDSTLTDHNRIGMGATDGTTQLCTLAHDENGISSTDANRRGLNYACIAISQTGASTIDGYAVFSSWGTNSVTINWTNAPSSAFRVTCYMFGGSDFDANVSAATLSGTVNNSVTVTPGLDPEAVMLIYGDNDLDDANDVWHRISFGFSVDDGSDTQRCTHFESADSVGIVDVSGIVSTNYAGYSAGGNEAIEVDNYTSTSYDLISRISGIGEEVICISMNLGGANVSIGTYSTSTTVTNKTENIGFEPGLVMGCLSTISATDSVITNADAGSFGLFGVTGNDSNSTNIYSDDAASTSNTACYTEDDRFILHNDDTGTIRYEGALTIVSNGFDVDFDTVDGTARQCVYIAFEKGDGGAAPTVKPWYQYEQERAAA